MADRAGPRQTGARHADLNQPHQRGGDRRAGAGVRLRHCRRCHRGADRGSRRPPARLADRAPPFERAIRGVPRVAVRPHQADAHARGQPRHHDPHRVADRGVPVLHRAGRARRRRDARRQCRAQQFSAVRRLFPRRPRQRRRAALRPRLWRARQGGLRRRGEARRDVGLWLRARGRRLFPAVRACVYRHHDGERGRAAHRARLSAVRDFCAAARRVRLCL